MGRRPSFTGSPSRTRQTAPLAGRGKRGYPHAMLRAKKRTIKTITAKIILGRVGVRIFAS